MQAYNDCEGESMNFWERDLHTNGQNDKNQQSNATKSNMGNPTAQTYSGCHSNPMGNFAVMEQLSRLGNMSEQERLGELAKTASAMKQDGRFNVQDLERVYQTAGMFMNAEQLSRLRALIDMLK